MPVASEVRGAARSGGEGTELGGGDLAVGFFEVRFGEGGDEEGKFGENIGLEVVALFGFHFGRDGEESGRVFGCPRPDANVMCLPAFFAEALIERAGETACRGLARGARARGSRDRYWWGWATRG